MKKGLTLSHLSDMIHKKLGTIGQDIEPEFCPHTSDRRNNTKLCIMIVLSKKEEVCTRPPSAPDAPQELFDKVFYDLIEFIANDLDEHGYLSFYHYLGMLTALSFHYADCIKEKKNQTVVLNNPDIWLDPTLDMAVLSLFFNAGVFFKAPLLEHSEMFEKNEGDIYDIIEYVIYHIKKLN